MIAFLVAICIQTPWVASATEPIEPDALAPAVEALLTEYCVDCHSEPDPNGEVDLAMLLEAPNPVAEIDLWEKIAHQVSRGTMPPDDALQPSADSRLELANWFRHLAASIEVRPAVHRPRRLSNLEYRNTLRSIFEFDLEVTITQAEQTISEKSLVMKLLPTDPPGASGFTNDTHRSPLTTALWDQYAYLSNVALDDLFGVKQRVALESIVGPIASEGISAEQAERLVRTLVPRIHRRPVSQAQTQQILARVRSDNATERVNKLKHELSAQLMSASFLYRGLLAESQPSEQFPVDQFELAERLSYFLWADMPDAQLWERAAAGSLSTPDTMTQEIERMLASPKARALAEIFASEWLSIREIEQVSDNPPKMVALRTQVFDFMDYLFTSQRPLLELIDSDTTFINVHTARWYGRDAKQLTKYVKQKGIEIEAVPNQQIELVETQERGGILTMPGILAMNRGPILRGVWMIERILGDELPEPPADIEPIEASAPGSQLTFRERFEAHRSKPSCALCHDKIDPLGFAMEAFDDNGQYILATNYRPDKKAKNLATPGPDVINTAGQLPSGEKFANAEELKRILTGPQKESVIRNLVERTMAYALCRELEYYDRPTIESIVEQMSHPAATWQDLFVAIASSVPFRETLRSESPQISASPVSASSDSASSVSASPGTGP